MGGPVFVLRKGAMTPAEVFEEAARRAAQLVVSEPTELALERLRSDAAAFFDEVPEPPPYRRSGQGGSQVAGALLGAASELLARCLALERASPDAALLGQAVRAHVEVLGHLEAGRVEAAAREWRRAQALERRALSARRIWSRSDEQEPPVYDRKSGRSRFDPRPEAEVRVKLVCPRPACRRPDEYVLSPRRSSHELTCRHCRRSFSTYVAEVRELELSRAGRRRSYRLRVEEPSGALSRIWFDDPGGAELSVAKRDLLAFLYADHRELRGVLNLSSGRLLWVGKDSACFVATAAFGEGAAELAAFRAFRDRVLLRSRLGTGAVRGYYLHGPTLAAVVSASPAVRAVTKRVLWAVHRALVRSGFRA